ncbi:hypothetical protein HPB49_006478 [Dermacentor silvarum]|uniref:Uncharacterized protein n=1 Tax=Dermacentor silvarum TaxID=543639 RepID=A0ACB8C7R3_DERSI|nr:hypothetical protein HPB49_006478 [Dermacentor silvarum]
MAFLCSNDFQERGLGLLCAAWLPTRCCVGVDLCCGPTLHQAAVLSRFTSKVYLADPEPANRAALRSWLEHQPDCPDYTPFLALAAAAEGLSEDEVGASLVECRLRDAVRGVLHCDLAGQVSGGATAHQRCLLPVKADVVFLLTRVLEDLRPDGADPGLHVAPLSRVRRVLRSGGLLALAGITSPAEGFKAALEDALITAGAPSDQIVHGSRFVAMHD